MNDLFALLHERFVLRALVVGLLLGLSGGMIGCFLVLRRLSLMADAFSHALLPGIAIAFLICGASLPGLLLGAAIAGLLTVLVSLGVARLTRVKEDAAFGALFVLLFAVGLAVFSSIAAPQDLMHYLFGSLYALTRDDAWLAAAVLGTTLIAIAIAYRPLVLETFDRGFHRACGGRSALTHAGFLVLTVLNLVAALKLLGTVLAVGLFVLPAVTAYLWCERIGSMLLLAATLGGAGAVLGQLIGLVFPGLPGGAAIVLCLGSLFLVSAVISPRYGILARLIRPRHHRSENDDALCDVPLAPERTSP